MTGATGGPSLLVTPSLILLKGQMTSNIVRYEGSGLSNTLSPLTNRVKTTSDHLVMPESAATAAGSGTVLELLHSSLFLLFVTVLRGRYSMTSLEKRSHWETPFEAMT